LTAINYDGGPYSITVPILGLSFVIAADNEDPAVDAT
jgi:hypothetical protein